MTLVSELSEACFGTYGEGKVRIVLEQDRHRTSKIRQPQRLNIMSIDENTPFRGIVYSSSKLYNSAFSGSIRTDYDLRCDVDTE
jgi:hypothetical protein